MVIMMLMVWDDDDGGSDVRYHVGRHNNHICHLIHIEDVDSMFACIFSRVLYSGCWHQCVQHPFPYLVN